jgi:hypothetical protein
LAFRGNTPAITYDIGEKYCKHYIAKSEKNSLLEKNSGGPSLEESFCLHRYVLVERVMNISSSECFWGGKPQTDYSPRKKHKFVCGVEIKQLSLFSVPLFCMRKTVKQ